MAIELSRIRRLAAALGFATLAAACAPLDFTPAQCSGPELERRGFLDGAEGRVGGYERLVELCAGVAARPDRETYGVGYAAGLRRYCTPGNGYRVGRWGGTYRNVCPADLEPAFLAAYSRGLAHWRDYLYDSDGDDDRFDRRRRPRPPRDNDDAGNGDGPSAPPPENGGPPPDVADDAVYEPGYSDTVDWDGDDGGGWEDDSGSDYDSGDSDSGEESGLECRLPEC